MKFNLEELENKINNIRNQSNSINTNIVKYSNKKQIELILYGFFFVLNYYYNIRKNEEAIGKSKLEIEKDKDIQNFLKKFNAKIKANSIKPIK